MGIEMSTFSARRPHMPSMPLHCCTSFTLAPVSLMRSRLLRPMFCALRWQGVWYVTVRGFSAATGVSLYTSFVDVWDAVEHLRQVLESGEWKQARFNQKAAVT